MPMEWMLDKKDRDKLTALRVLIERQNQEVSVATLQEVLGWSKYLVITVTGELLIDYAKVFPAELPLFRITKDERFLMVGRASENAHADLQLMYLRRSVYWQLLWDMFHERMTSYEDFANRYLTTISTTRNAKLVLAEHLATDGILISDQYHLVGPELNLRSYIFRLLQTYFGNRDFPFDDDLLARVEKLIPTFRSAIVPAGQIRLTKQMAMRLILAIWFIRLDNGHWLPEDVTGMMMVPTADLTPAGQHFIENTMTEVGQLYPDLSATILEWEARQGLFLLYTMDYGQYLDPLQNLSAYPLARINDFMQVADDLFTSYFHRHMTEAEREPILERLHSTILAYLGLADDAEFREGKPDIGAYMTHFPIFVEFTLNVLYEVAKRWGRNQRLLEDYLFVATLTTFISAIDMKSLFPVVRVMIDVNYLRGLEEMITRDLQSLPETRVEITPFYDETVDLIITDVAVDKEIRQRAFQLAKAPSSAEFEVIRQRLAQIKYKKFNQNWQ